MQVFGQLGSEVVGGGIALVVTPDLVKTVVERATKCVLERKEHCTAFAIGTGCVCEFPVKFCGFEEAIIGFV